VTWRPSAPRGTAVGNDNAVEENRDADVGKVHEVLRKFCTSEAGVGRLERLRGYADARPLPPDALVVRIWAAVGECRDCWEEEAVRGGEGLGRRYVERAVEAHKGKERVSVRCRSAIV
jgi:hypothetical protein